MRILIIFDDYFGGAGNVAQLLARELREDNDVILMPTNEHTSPRYELSNIRLAPYRLQVRKSDFLFLGKRILTPLRCSILEHSPDLVISFLDVINTLVCLSLRDENVALIVSERNDPIKSAPSPPWGIMRRYAYERADIITVQFPSFISSLGKKLERKVRVTPNIIQPAPHKTVPAVHHPLRLVSVGRLTHQKRFDRMLAIMGRFIQSHPDATLSIYGDGELREQLSLQVKESGLSENVLFMGVTSDVHAALIESDVFLMTSQFEGFPNALSEALAVGLPSVSYACHQGIRDLVGEGGIVVEEGDVDSYLGALNELATSNVSWMRCSRGALDSADRYGATRVVPQWKQCMSDAMRLAASRK